MNSRTCLIVLTAAVIGTMPAHALTVDEYLDLVRINNGAVLAGDLATRAAEGRRELGDLELSPFLTASAGALDDRIETQQPFAQGTRTRSFSYSLGVAKKFSTGTIASLDYGSRKTRIDGTQPAIEDVYTNALGFTLSQSLWKDFFGRATRLRRDRELTTLELEQLSERVKTTQLLVNAENAYWIYLYKRAEVDSRKASLERARKIHGWYSRRVSSGISTGSDLLQAEALLTQRQVQHDQSVDELNAALASLRVSARLENEGPEPTIDTALLNRRRDLFNIVGAEPTAAVIRLDAELTRAEARLKRATASETREGLKPELNLQLQLTSNGRDPTAVDSIGEVASGSHPTVFYGVNFRMNLDQRSVGTVARASALDAEAAARRAEQSRIESDSSWRELVRRYEELNRRIEVVARLADIQKRKSEQEDRRMRNGRSTTFQVVQFEQDSADAELLLLQLQSEARKLEAQARLFHSFSSNSEDKS